MIPAEINVDQSTQLTSEQWEVAFNDSEAFVNRASLSTVDIDIGLLDPYLVPDLVSVVAGGIIDEYELHKSVTASGEEKISSVLRGRNAAAYAVDSTVYVTYAVGGIVQPQPTDSGFTGLAAVPGVTVPLVLYGSWTAKRVAEDLCRRVGLSCVWQAPDYVLREDFPVNGPVDQAIQTLAEPFSHFESSKVDTWAEGTQFIVRQRGKGGPGTTLSIHDARISNLMVRSRTLGYVRVVRLTGSTTGVHVGPAVDPGNKTTENIDEIIDPDTGQVIVRVVTRETTRILDHALISQTIETFVLDTDEDKPGGARGLVLTSLQETNAEWDSLILVFPNQIVNSPKERKKTTVMSSLDESIPSTPVFGPTSRTTVLNSYDSNGFLTATASSVESYQPGAPGAQGGLWVMDSREVKTYRDAGTGMYEITTIPYGSDGTPGDIHRTKANGSRPGGPGRSARRSATTVDLPPVTLGAIVSTHAGAKDFTLSNGNLLEPELRIIMAQAVAENGIEEIQITFTAVGIPWLKRGQYLDLTGLEDEFGYEVPIQNTLVTDSKVEYREGESSSYMTSVTAVYWE